NVLRGNYALKRVLQPGQRKDEVHRAPRRPRHDPEPRAAGQQPEERVDAWEKREALYRSIGKETVRPERDELGGGCVRRIAPGCEQSLHPVGSAEAMAVVGPFTVRQ